MDSNTEQGLRGQIIALQSKLTAQERIIKMCLSLIGEFGHFVPNAVEVFNQEVKKLEDTDGINRIR